MVRFLWACVSLCLLVTILGFSLAPAAVGQDLRLIPESAGGEAEIYVDDAGNTYARLIKFNFNVRAFAQARGVAQLDLSVLNQQEAASRAIRSAIVALRNDLGAFSMRKTFPTAIWGETTLRSKLSGGTFEVAEQSQMIELHFEDLVDIAATTAWLEALPFVKWAEGPSYAIALLEPVDNRWNEIQTFPGFLHTGDYEQWALRNMNAPQAWDMTKGRNAQGSIEIGINDIWGTVDVATYGDDARHPDLGWESARGHYRLDNSAVANRYGGNGSSSNDQSHGVAVATVAGAITNNTWSVTRQWVTGVSQAALGWDVKMRGSYWTEVGIREATCTVQGQPPSCEPVDIMNMSWVGASSSQTTGIGKAVHDALKAGVVVVAGAGNTEPSPRRYFPAAFAYPDGLQVIAATASDYHDEFFDGYNYSPCGAGQPRTCDPVNDPTYSFIDVAAPGREVASMVTRPPGNSGCPSNAQGNTLPCHINVTWDGTSFSSPLVSAVVALVKSVNPALGPRDIYDIVTGSALKVGQYNYDVTGANGNSWNRYMGYGRLDAYAALKYTLENYGGTLGGPGSVVTINETLDIKSGAVLEIRPGTTVRMAPNASLILREPVSWVGSQYNVIRFERANPSSKWGEVIIWGDGSTLEQIIFDGGDDNLTVRADNVTIQSITSKNGRTGIYFHSAANADVSGSVVEDNLARNIYVRNSSGIEISNSTIENSVNGSGVYVINSSVGCFNRNIVSGNQTQGVVVASGSYFDTDCASGGGKNRISGNGSHEVYVDPGSDAFFGAGDGYADKNAIFADGTGGKRFFRAVHPGEANTIIQAIDNYWDGSNQVTSPTLFGNPSYIVYQPEIYSDPTTSVAGGCGAGICTSEFRNRPSAGAESSPQADRSRTQFRDLSASLKSGELAGSVEALHQLRALTAYRATHHPAGAEAVRRQSAEVYAAWAARRTDASSATRNAAHVATNLLLAELVRLGELDQAEQVAREFATVEKRPSQAHAYALNRFRLAEARSDMEQALAWLGEVQAIDVELARADAAYEPADFSLLYEELEAELGETEVPSVSAASETAPRTFDIKGIYPNPVRDRAMLPLSMPERGAVRVSVYDLTGRVVKEVADQQVEAGQKVISLETTGLASGMYIVRARTQSARGLVEVATAKMVVVP